MTASSPPPVPPSPAPVSQSGVGSLIDDLTNRIAQIDTEGVLAAFMGAALKSLLRRGGDIQFRQAIQDAYVERVAGIPFDKQRAVAKDVLRTVVELRPEIAVAWAQFQSHQTGGEDLLSEAPPYWGGPERRHLDSPALERAAKPHVDLASLDAEALTSHFIAEQVARRLALFHVARPSIPSMAYYRDRPFFLFDRNFHLVLARFLAEVLAPLCRPVLRRLIHRELEAKSNLPLDAKLGLLSSRQAEIIKALGQRLGALDLLHRSAHEAIAKSQNEEGEPTWKEVHIPQNRPRSVSVLGMKIPLGTATSHRVIRVRTDGGRDLTPDEVEALTLFTQLQNMAAGEGVEMPDACDFQFIRLLLEFDMPKFSAALKELSALATHSMTNEEFLLSRVMRAENFWPIVLADLLLLLLFMDASEQGFGIANLQHFCIGTSTDPRTLAQRRPFLYWELSRRLRELALQIREVMETRQAVNTLEASIRRLFAAWKIMARGTFGPSFEVALGVLATFPIVFTGHPDEQAFTAIAERLRASLSDPSPDYESALLAATTMYSQVLKRNDG